MSFPADANLTNVPLALPSDASLMNFTGGGNEMLNIEQGATHHSIRLPSAAGEFKRWAPEL